MEKTVNTAWYARKCALGVLTCCVAELALLMLSAALTLRGVIGEEMLNRLVLILQRSRCFGLRGRGGADEQTRDADSVLRGGFLACDAGDRYSCIRRTAAGTVAANGGCDGGGSGSVTFDEKRKEKGERKQGACTARTQVNIKGTCILKRCFC